MTFEQIIKELAITFGIPGLEASTNGDVTLGFDNMIVTIDSKDTDIFFLTQLGKVSDYKAGNKTGNKVAIYDFLLKASNLGKLDGYVGINDDTDILSLVSKANLNYSDSVHIMEILKKHIESAEFLIKNLEEIAKQIPANKESEFVDFSAMLRA